MKYASGTHVPTDRSLAEIRRTLDRYKATGFALIEKVGKAIIGFEMCGRAIRMALVLPEAAQFGTTDRGRRRTNEAAHAERDKAVRQLWRALALIVKAKLEAVESGITTFETEWLPYMVLQNGKTVAEEIGPQIEAGKSPTLTLGMD